MCTTDYLSLIEISTRSSEDMRERTDKLTDIFKMLKIIDKYVLLFLLHYSKIFCLKNK